VTVWRKVAIQVKQQMQRLGNKDFCGEGENTIGSMKESTTEKIQFFMDYHSTNSNLVKVTNDFHVAKSIDTFSVLIVLDLS
jgi:hypothetical protein